MTDKTTNTPNKGGRPLGARNKSLLMKSQLLIDENSLTAVENLVALAKNDTKHFGMKGDIPATIILTANKILLDKAVANEKEKAPSKDNTKSVEEKDTKPRVFASAG